jgi:GNAT superfamily N-acetyltransferase
MPKPLAEKSGARPWLYVPNGKRTASAFSFGNIHYDAANSIGMLTEMSRVKQVLRMLAARGLGEYRFNRIYRLERFSPDLALPAGIVCSPLQSPPSEMVDSRLLGRFSYAGEDAHGFGLFVEGKLAALCWVWGPRRFRDPLLWQLSEGEAIMVDLMTPPEFRGLGLATLLIRYAGMQMQHAGTQDLYTWVWHSHSASSRAFEKVGWRQIGWVLEVDPLGRGHPLSVRWPVIRIGSWKSRRQRRCLPEAVLGRSHQRSPRPLTGGPASDRRKTRL